LRILRIVSAVVAGIVSGGLTVAVVEVINSLVFPPPTELDLTDHAALMKWMQTLPVTAFVVVVIGWMLGGFVATYVGRRVAPDRMVQSGIIPLVVFLAATVMNLFTISHPWWMWPVGLVLVLLGGGFGLVASRPGSVAMVDGIGRE
jgi:MFS family permease